MDNLDRNYIVVASVEKINFIKMKDIICCSADGRCTSFFTNDGKEFVACKSLGEYERELDVKSFFRVHQSYIVNLSYIHTIKKDKAFFCEMTNKMKIPISIRRQNAFCRFIGLK